VPVARGFGANVVFSLLSLAKGGGEDELHRKAKRQNFFQTLGFYRGESSFFGEKILAEREGRCINESSFLEETFEGNQIPVLGGRREIF